MMRYDPYTDSFINDSLNETTRTAGTTATINLNTSPTYTVRNIVEVSDESIEKIAEAVVRKLADRTAETNVG